MINVSFITVSTAMLSSLICFTPQALAMDPPREIFLPESIDKFSDKVFSDMGSGKYNYEEVLIRNVGAFFPAHIGASVDLIPGILNNICAHIQDERQQNLCCNKLWHRVWIELKDHDPQSIAEGLTYIHVKLLLNAIDERQLSSWNDVGNKSYITYILNYSENCRLFFQFLIQIDPKNYLKLFFKVAKNLEKMRNYYGLFVIYFALDDHFEKFTPKQRALFDKLKLYNFDNFNKESAIFPSEGPTLPNYNPYLHWYFGACEKNNEAHKKIALDKLINAVESAKNYSIKENSFAKIIIKLPKIPVGILFNLKMAAKINLERDKSFNDELFPSHATKPIRKWNFNMLSNFILDYSRDENPMAILINLCLIGIEEGSQINELLKKTDKNKLKLLTTLFNIDKSTAQILIDTNDAEKNITLAHTSSDGGTTPKRKSSLLRKVSKKNVPKIKSAPPSPVKPGNNTTAKREKKSPPSVPWLNLNQ